MTQHEKFQEIYDGFLAELEEAGITFKIVLQACSDKPISSSKHERGGHIYLIQDEYGLCKIGKAKDVQGRFRGLQTASSAKLDLIWSIYFENQDKLKAAEKTLHRKYAFKCKHGEWFDLSDEDIAWIKEWKGGHD